VHPDFVVATEMLPVPKTADLTTRQINGGRCVWCGVTAKVRLGPRLAVVDGELLRWHPSGCRRCARREAGTAYDEHIRNCARCTRLSHSRLLHCDDAQALHELAHQAPASDR